MAVTIPEITDRNQVASMSDRELLEEIYLRVLEVERMYLAWQTGGLRGLRQARRA